MQDVNGDTALHDAARFGHLSCVQLLLPVTDSSIKNKEGKNVLEVAIQYKQDKIANYLSHADKSKL